MVEIGSKCSCKVLAEKCVHENAEQRKELYRLIGLRKETRTQAHKEQVRVISKRIQREIRAITRARKKTRIGKILEDFRGLWDIATIRYDKKQSKVASLKADDGKVVHGTQEIADTFADFYEALYTARDGTEDSAQAHDKQLFEDAPSITLDEVSEQVKRLLRRKAGDTNGVVAELFKNGGDVLMQSIAQISTDILKPHADVPAYWKETRLKVILKKGDPQLPDNYRPIAILPIFYKLFSRAIWARIKGILNEAQTCDQAGFRAGFNCEDHLFAISLIAEKMNELSQPLWVVAVDFKKAFDTINHRSLWQAMIEQGVPLSYIRCY